LSGEPDATGTDGFPERKVTEPQFVQGATVGGHDDVDVEARIGDADRRFAELHDDPELLHVVGEPDVEDVARPGEP
jgi:hypothetical protein